MTSIAGLNNFNNLLYATKRMAISDELEHRAGRVGMDLQFKGYANIDEVLTTAAAKINGKRADIKYTPDILHSRPYYGYDARIDPTLLNSVRNKYVDVSGLLIPNKDLPKNKNNMENCTFFSKFQNFFKKWNDFLKKFFKKRGFLKKCFSKFFISFFFFRR